MRKILFINIFVLCILSSYAQKRNNRLIVKYENTLKVMAHTIMNAETTLPFNEANPPTITIVKTNISSLNVNELGSI